MQKFRNLPILFAALCMMVALVGPLHAQSQDFGLWSGAEVDAKMAKAISVRLSGEIRLNDTLTNVDALLAELGMNVKLSRHFDVFGEYRLGRQAGDFSSFNTTNRFTLGGKTDWNLARLRVAYQLRYDYEFVRVYSNGYNLDKSKAMRSKITIAYNLPKSKIEPFIMCELFYDLTPYKEREFYKVRYRAGAKIPMYKHHALELFLQYQKKLNGQDNTSLAAIGIFYSWGTTMKEKPINTEVPAASEQP